MFYATNDAGVRIPPIKGAHATCPLCKRRVIAKCGQRKVWHWAHGTNENDCDPWGESETRWHRRWQERADADCCEVIIGEHRADIRRRDGLVIELQHSWIAPADVTERQRFYGNMWWLFDSAPWKNFRVWASSDGIARYRWMTTRRTLDYVTVPFFIDLGGPVLKVEKLGPQGCGSGYGSLLTRAAFIDIAGLRSLSDLETTATSHYALRTVSSPHHAVRNDDAEVIVPSLELARWAFYRGDEVTITRHDLGGRTTSETFVCMK